MLPDNFPIPTQEPEPPRVLATLCAACWKSAAPAACPSAYRWCPDMGQSAPAEPRP